MVKQLKKISFLSLFLGLNATELNPYVAISAGYARSKDDLSIYDHDQSKTLDDTTIIQKISGSAFGAHFGGGTYYNQFYIGAETGFMLDNSSKLASRESTFPNYKTRFQKKSIINLSLRIGYKFSDSISLYLRPGMNRTQYYIKTFDGESAANLTPEFVAEKQRYRKSVISHVLGVGTEYYIGQYGVGFEASRDFGKQFETYNSQLNDSSKVRIKTNYMQMRFIYKF